MPFVVRGQDFKTKSIFSGTVLTALLMMLIVVETITSIGVPIASRLVYPSYELARQLQISDFLDRFDLALAAATLPCIITKIAFDLYFVCWGLKRMIPKVSGKVLTGPIALMGFVCAFWFFRNAIQLNRFTREWTWIAIVFEVIFPMVFFLFLRPRKRKHSMPRILIPGSVRLKASSTDKNVSSNQWNRKIRRTKSLRSETQGYPWWRKSAAFLIYTIKNRYS